MIRSYAVRDGERDLIRFLHGCDAVPRRDCFFERCQVDAQYPGQTKNLEVVHRFELQEGG